MKRIFVFLLVVTALVSVTVTSASAASVLVSRNAGYYSGDGGEFTLVPSNDFIYILNTYDGDALFAPPQGPVGFQSFCMEWTEHVSPNNTTPYYVQLNTGAVNGGASGQTSPNFDPISVGTAWLYHEFQKGELKGYDDTTKLFVDYDYNPLAGRAASAVALQNTIWWLEGEASDPGVGNLFRNAVVKEFGSSLVAMENNGSNSFSNAYYAVGVLNLWTSPNFAGVAQDMLVCLPVPEPTTLLLLGAGLIGFVALRKRFTK